MKKRKTVLISVLLILLLLGIFLGGSITTFILFLNKHEDLLAILSYLFLIVFILFLMLELFLFMHYRHLIFLNKEGQTSYEEEKE